ncbi:DUF6630 family protein [Campylobacter mucosalis]|uniref:DUF6630 family protein n=1 Tax=Campylobacter mucosalis TaxID=202 RepID=UPI0014704D11|nr:hypothetical protein [Campylobacter mucosalis]
MRKLKEVKAYKEPKATKGDLAKFLKFCGVDDDFVAKNLDEIFKNLQNGDIYDDELTVFSVLLDEAYSAHSDHKFDSQDVKNFMQNLAINSADFKPKKGIKQDDLLVCFREFLVSQGFWLCNFDTQSDSYLFMAFELENIDEVMDLAKRLKLPLEDFFR